jgi:hypothetical protein
MDTGKSALWIDATNDGDTNFVTAADVPSPTPMVSVGLRQNTQMGTLSIDELKVSVAFSPRITEIRTVGGNVEIDFSTSSADPASSFGIESASDVAGSFSDVSASIVQLAPGSFRATLPLSGSQGFYRVKRPVFIF